MKGENAFFSVWTIRLTMRFVNGKIVGQFLAIKRDVKGGAPLALIPTTKRKAVFPACCAGWEWVSFSFSRRAFSATASRLRTTSVKRTGGGADR